MTARPESGMFADGEYYEDFFDTPAGRLGILAEVHILARHLVLEEILIYPADDPNSMVIGVKYAFALKRHLRDRARTHGFEQLTVILHRVGKRRHGRTMTYTRRLL